MTRLLECPQHGTARRFDLLDRALATRHTAATVVAVRVVGTAFAILSGMKFNVQEGPIRYESTHFVVNRGGRHQGCFGRGGTAAGFRTALHGGRSSTTGRGQVHVIVVVVAVPTAL